ncbi:N-6 DNA methylase [Anaerovorax sp. IOR16]|uniref:N-6 DNA methylase n=1 Tax=Anaerovorax sp. IOR16 TaxID=2773458 RepID=UPI0019D191DD|nr:N-6 DNA methylase [Anaerovorax sp. IOR16]
MSRGRITTENPEFIKLFRTLCGGKYQTWQVWSDFIYMTAAAISNRVDNTHFDEREEQYLNIISKYTKTEAEIFPKMYAELVKAMEISTEQDFLGNLYMQLELGNHWKGQFFTPYSICKCMSGINTKNLVERIETDGYITVNDPSCGAGATLIAFANSVNNELYHKKSNLNWQNHILFTAQDIDTVTGLMCYIQLSLMGCAGYVKIADSLLYPMVSNDDLTYYWFTPMYFSRVWQYRRIFHGLDNLMFSSKKSKPKDIKTKKEPSPPEYNVKLTEVKAGQLALF